MSTNRDNERPWPIPTRPWVMAQTWQDLLFAHWRVEPALLQKLIPQGLTVETFGGSGWLGIVPFRMTDVKARWLPSLLNLSAFPELNVRTYVTDGAKPGVWFFSLDAGNWTAVAGGRRLFRLPYYRAEMALDRKGEIVTYRSERKDRRGGQAMLEVEYEPVGPALAPPGSLARWLTYRYCLYAAGGDGRLYRTEIDHPPWPLHQARATFSVNTMTAALGLQLAGEPLCHFSRVVSVVV